ncbi:MAG TPA: beta-propeller fold lactonase family protein [Nitrososphaeraceae archaeon]|nr:beta-propeller fold lactonase family protein [Nitrososphaeraceae archaeon]
MNKIFTNLILGIFAVILLTSTLTVGVQNGKNIPKIGVQNGLDIPINEKTSASDNINEKTSASDNNIQASQHPIIQMAEGAKEIPNEIENGEYNRNNADVNAKQPEQQQQQDYAEPIYDSGKVNEVTIKAERLPNGQYAYRMIEHILSDGTSKEDLTKRYPQIPTIPGPAIEINQNELLILHSIDEKGEKKTQKIEGKDIGSFEYFGDQFRTLGLFGAIIINPIDKVPAQVDGKIVNVGVDQLDKQFVLFMVGSTFWGQEIDANHNQKPLWTNPNLGADLNQLVRFHVLGAAHQHTFHLHAHRWLDPGTTDIIDTKLIQPKQSHWFIVEAGDRVGTGDWQYHCHVFAHMEAGMMGTFTVGKVGSNTKSVPGVGPSISGKSIEEQGQGNFITFDVSDEPGQWFRNVGGEVAPDATRSLGIVQPGGTAHFIMSGTNTVHTITSLLWPTNAPNMPFDQLTAYRGGGIVQLEKPGLYVFTCKIHPYMLGAMIVDNPKTKGLDFGEKLSTAAGGELDPINDKTGKSNPNAIGTALALLRTFFVANNPSNWIDYNQPFWDPKFPSIDIDFGGIKGNLKNLLVDTVGGLNSIDLWKLKGKDLYTPEQNGYNSGVGEVWVDTQFEKTAHKSKPGTATRVNVEDWIVERKVSLPEINMNNPHNMWSDREQKIIYQTQWFDNMLTAFDRETGKFLDNIRVGDAPSHVMTRPGTDLIYVALSGEQGVAELKFNKENYKFEMKRIIPLQESGQNPTHPHGFWISEDGNKMITPNHFTNDVTIFDFDAMKYTGKIQNRTPTGAMPIATGMTPDGKTAYVANFLSSDISVVNMNTGKVTDTINLASSDHTLPIQTPVSPDGKYVVTANTLSGTISVIDTKTNEIIAGLPCDPGCHGVNFGAKYGGGYYAYVSSKFSNRMIVVDVILDKYGNPIDAKIAGSVILTGDYDLMDRPLFETDDKITDYFGMGGQGVYAIPNVNSGWAQQLDTSWKLTPEQRNPLLEEDQQQQVEQQMQDQQQQVEQQMQDQQQQVEQPMQEQLKQQEILQMQQDQYQHQPDLQSVEPLSYNSNEATASPPDSAAKMNVDPQQQYQQKLPKVETYADKIAKVRQETFNQRMKMDVSQELNNNQGSFTPLITNQQSQPEQQEQHQEKKTSQVIEHKLAEIQQRSLNEVLAPPPVQETTNPSIDKVGNIISMLPVPYP